MMTKKFIVSTDSISLAPDVVTYTCEYDVDAYHDGWFDVLGVVVPANLHHAVVKRKAEYLAGRHVAQAALAALGWKATGIAVAPDRSPVWPMAVVGTITHTGRHALSSVARRGSVRGLGIDVEPYISQQLGAAIYSNVVSIDETRYLLSLSMPFEHALTITFSAKESLYKALYPEVRKFFDFAAAELLFIDPENRTFSLCLRHDLSTYWRQGVVVSGTYSLYAGSVMTHIVIPSQCSAKNQIVA